MSKLVSKQRNTPSAPKQNVAGKGERFIKNQHGVVLDTKTGLEWIVGPDYEMSWFDARIWVRRLAVDGGDWRLPTTEELKSIYIKGEGTHNMTPLLKMTGKWVWANRNDPWQAWDFTVGRTAETHYIDPWDSLSSLSRAFGVRSRK